MFSFSCFYPRRFLSPIQPQGKAHRGNKDIARKAVPITAYWLPSMVRENHKIPVLTVR